MRTRREKIRFILGLTVGLIIALLVASGTLLYWVATGPRLLTAIPPRIENAFNAEGGRYHLKIDETWLVWDSWKHPIDIRLRGVSVYTQEGQLFSRFPEIAIGVHLPSLFTGSIAPTSIYINHPVISLYQNENGAINFGFVAEPAEGQPAVAAPTLPFAAILEPFLNPETISGLHKLRHISIRNADVSVGNAAKGVFFEARNVDLAIKRRRQQRIEMLAGGRLRYGDYQSPVSSHFVLDKRAASISGNVEFSGIEFNSLSALFSQAPLTLPVDMPLSGNSRLTLDMNGALQQLEFSVDGGQGTISSAQLSGPLGVNWAHIEGKISNRLNDISVSKFMADVDGMTLAASGSASRNAAGDLAISGEGSIKNIAGENVPKLWPPSLAPLSREWITENITRAYIPAATAKININYGDLAKPILPKEAVDATIQLEGAQIKHLPEHPPTTKINGVIHVDGVALDATISSGHFLKETELSNGRVLIADLNAENPYIKVSFDAETTAKDIVKLLDLPRLKHADRLNLKEEGAEGAVKGSAALGFYFFAPKGSKDTDIDYDIQAELSNVSAKNFMKKFDIEKASGAIAINNQKVEFAGKTTVNGAAASAATVKYLFVPEGGFDTFITAAGTANKETLTRFGYPKFDFLNGMLGVKADMKIGEAAELTHATVDLTQAAINADAISWNKPQNTPAALDITAEKKNGVLVIPSFHLQADNINAKGSARLNPALTSIEQLQMDAFTLGNTNLNKLIYETGESGMRLDVTGKSVDVSGYMSGDSSDFSFEHFPAIDFNADIDQVIMSGGQALTNVKGGLQCTKKICASANIAGVSGGKPFHFRILRNPKGKRQLSIRAENAGAFLRASGIYDKMEGGDLTITGNYEDGGKTSLLRARLDINEHVIKKAPILTKILSLASLTGFIDTLQGNGIRFTKLAAPFTLKGDVITIDKGKAYGPAIGMTAEGTITMPEGAMDINGTVVPSYTVNTVLGKLPILGDILTGGGDGKGVFAATYTVRGTDKDPKVSVNPLSILAPGFLRGLFDAGGKADN